MKGKYDKLIIIGNGFDIWQGLPTSYSQFRKYYIKNIQRITKYLKIKGSIGLDGSFITPVEMVFGDIFKPGALSDEFFYNFETSLSVIDDQKLALYFGKTNSDVLKVQETVNDALRILRFAFAKWVKSILIEEKEEDYFFDERCYFINFNYTDTLEKRFNVNSSSIEYIHGDFLDPMTLVFGHSKHPELALLELMIQKYIHLIGGGKSKRLRELYVVENALYETDKHVQDNIDDMCEFMALNNLHIEDINDIYVLGHSFGAPDYQYFKFLNDATKIETDINKLSALWRARHLFNKKITNKSYMDWLHMNIIYASQHRRRELKKENISFPNAELLERKLFGKNDIYTDSDGKVHELDNAMEKARKAVHKRFLMEQAYRTKEVIKELCELKGITKVPKNCYSVLGAADYIDGGHDKRTRNAKWHISYHTDEDKIRIENTMNRINCQEYRLYEGIDSCLEEFKKNKF